MIKPFLALIVPVVLTVGVFADEASAQSSSVTKNGVPELPANLKNFNGMLLGRLVSKDVEKGSFVVEVDAVPRVWQNSKAKEPGSVIGKQVEVSGVFGKFLDVLVVARKGETIEFECKHDGDRLVFPGELLRKAAPYDPEDYPVPPDSFRGFQGIVVADVVKKDPETLEMILKVDRLVKVWDGNQAREPKSIEGKKLMLAGFWQRKDQYHTLKVGDRLEVGMRHISRQSNHLTVREMVRKIAKGSREAEMMREESKTSRAGMTKELNGFRGMLVGKLVEKDVERGTFSISVDAVPRVWKNNESSSPKNYIGKRVDAGGVQGKMLDVLVVTRIGETLEFGAFDEGADRMRVVELLRKTAPVQPGDYPELPSASRGLRGILRGKVVKKDQQMMELIVEVDDVVQLFPANRAEDAKSLIGNKAMLVGFWKRKEAYNTVRVGDMIEFGAEHPQRLSDHLSVIESFKKVER